MSTDKLITLAIHTFEKANEIKPILEAQGIEVTIQNVNLSNPEVSSGVRVRIHESDLPHALAILEKRAGMSSERAEEKDGITRVLIPVDFSDYSLLACRMGFDFAASHAKSEVKLLHSYMLPTTRSFQIPEFDLKERDNIRLIQDAAKTEMSRFIDDIATRIERGEIPSIPFSGQVSEGVPEEAILRYAKDYSPSLIVMGTRGKNQKELDLIGSVTAEVFDAARYPVFAVPENFAGTGIQDIRKIAFFTTFEQQDLILLDNFMRLATDLKFELVFLHLADGQDAWTEVKLSGLKDYCDKYYPGRSVETSMIGQENFLENLEKFLKEAGIDMLVIGNRKRNIFARLFNPSMAHKMLFHSDTPLLVIPSKG